MSVTLSTFIQLNGIVNCTWIGIKLHISHVSFCKNFRTNICLLLWVVCSSKHYYEVGLKQGPSALLLKIKLGKNKTYVNTSFLTIEITCAHILTNTGLNKVHPSLLTQFKIHLVKLSFVFSLFFKPARHLQVNTVRVLKCTKVVLLLSALQKGSLNIEPSDQF